MERNPLFIDVKKRNKYFSTLNLEEVAVLKSSENAEYIANEFDKIFLKLQRLISYSTLRNNSEKNKLEEDTNNLLKKFVNYIKWKILSMKSYSEQSLFFYDISEFLNFFDGDTYFTKMHNSVPKTTIREFNEKTVSEQFFQTSYWRERWIDWMSEGWSCSYWTVLLYNFFNKLKEAWLDLDIRFFRYKNLEDRILDYPTMRHSWLIIKFHWSEYFVDQEWIQIWWREQPIVRKLQPYIDIARDKMKDENICKFFENFKYDNMKENDHIVFFDNIDDFLSHYEKYPPYRKISFYLPRSDSDKPDRITFEFVKNWIWVAVNGHWHIYYPKNNHFNKENILSSIENNIAFEKDINWIHPITKESKESFKKFFALVSDKINIDWLYDNFMTYWERSNKLINLEWKDTVVMITNWK